MSGTPQPTPEPTMVPHPEWCHTVLHCVVGSRMIIIDKQNETIPVIAMLYVHIVALIIVLTSFIVIN